MVVVDRAPDLAAPRLSRSQGEKQFDYIVVGGGSAGCVLASRLTEDPDIAVLLIEAGPHGDARDIRDPSRNSRLLRSSRDWRFEAEPAPGLNRRRLPWPRGRTLGGSDALGPGFYTPPPPAAIDAWHIPGWSAAELGPFFHVPVKLELASEDPMTRVFLGAAFQFGLEHNPGLAARRGGAGLYARGMHGGTRQTPFHTHLAGPAHRPNLTIKTGLLAQRIIFAGRRAVGVECGIGRTNVTFAVRQEVLVCAGAARSPQLLMLSGVGPAQRLRGCAVDVVADVPGTGDGLVDPLTISVAFERLDDPPHRIARLLRANASLPAAAGAFASLSPGPVDDAQLTFLPGAPGGAFELTATHLFPRSRGSVSLRGRDSALAPLIRANYLWDDDDLQALVAAVGLLREIAGQLAFEPFRGDELTPGEDLTSNAQLAAFVRATARPAGAPVGTCRMGDDDASVVDAKLRVHGVDGLRVIGGCVMPTPPGTLSNATTVAIAERAAAIINGTASVAIPVPASEPHPSVP